MRFRKHFELEGRHAFLSPSQYSWIRYTEDKLDIKFSKMLAARRGTELHDFAQQAIRLGIRMPKTRATLNQYINDCIGFKMSPEQPLYYSDNVFGTADAVGFDLPEEGMVCDGILRIYDLKTGETPTKIDQLMVYAALFCLEYGFQPFSLVYDLRIYQLSDVKAPPIDPGEIAHIMSTIKAWDKRVEELKMEYNG